MPKPRQQAPGPIGPAPQAREPEVRLVPIDQIRQDPGNLRRRDDETRGMLRKSLRRFGPFRSIAIDGQGIARAGNGTLEAAAEAGIDQVLVVKAPPGVLVAVQRDDLSERDLKAYGAADNRLTDRSKFDEQGVVELARSLQSEEYDLESIGFTADEIDQLCERLADRILDETPDEIPIGDGASGTPAGRFLTWDREVKIPITDQEAAMLDRALQDHRARVGSTFGFVRSLLRV